MKLAKQRWAGTKEAKSTRPLVGENSRMMLAVGVVTARVVGRRSRKPLELRTGF